MNRPARLSRLGRMGALMCVSVCVAACQPSAESAPVTTADEALERPLDAPELPSARLGADELPLSLVETSLAISDLGALGVPIPDGVSCFAGTLRGPLFRSDSADLTPEADQLLDELAGRLSSVTGTVIISGHTDKRASSIGNQRLSEMRAETVRSALIDRGIVRPITTVGLADRAPLATGTDADSMALNRRVEILATCEAS